MLDIASPQILHRPWRRAFLLGLAVFLLLWILSVPYRAAYVPTSMDIPALADGLLLSPGAHWQTWFTHGYSDFWDDYPEWPLRATGFTRPAFQFMIYVAHFALGNDWASYQVINCLAVAGLAAVAFLIAQTALGLSTSLSLLAAILVVLSPPVLLCWVFGLASAHELIATFFVAGAFLAVVARRDFFCLLFLFAGLLIKENAVWAPLAAAMTIMLRANDKESAHRRSLTAAAMFLPVAVWLCIRFAFFGGIGGTYATTGYTPVTDFLRLAFQKLIHINLLFVSQYSLVTSGPWALLDHAIRIGTIIVVYSLLSLWALRVLPEAIGYLRHGIYKARWPTVDAIFLVALWAAIALAFHFALALPWWERYAPSVCVFVWPALVAEAERRGKAVIWLGVALCSVVAIVRSAYFNTVQWATNAVQNEPVAVMNAALHEVPTTTRQIYVLGDSLQYTNPKYVGLVLDVSAEIVRISDIDWGQCNELNLVSFDHNTSDGVVNVTISLPSCAEFYFANSRFGVITPTNGRLYRNPTMSYELPEGHPVKPWPSFYLGRKMIVHVRPNGPARFIIEHGGANGIAWFDIP